MKNRGNVARGSKVQSRLKERRAMGLPYTQRWLLKVVKSRGFPRLTEPTLSNILSGSYVDGCADEVLGLCETILDENEASDEVRSEKVS